MRTDTNLVPWVPVREQSWTLLNVTAGRGANHSGVRAFLNVRLSELAEGFAGKYSRRVNSDSQGLVALECENDAIAVKLACHLTVQRYFYQTDEARQIIAYADQKKYNSWHYGEIARDLKMDSHFVLKVLNAYSKGKRLPTCGPKLGRL